MVNRALYRKLGRDVRQRKWALAALAIIIGVGVSCYVGMAAVYRDLDGSRERYYRDYRLADFSVDLKRAPASAVDAAAEMPNVRSVRGRVSLEVSIDLGNTPEPISGRAISMPRERRPVLNDVLIRSGTWFSGRDEREVIINDAFARANGLVPGSRIKVLMLDKQHDLLVVGTAMSPEFVYLMSSSGGLAPDPKMFGVLYLTEDFLQKSSDLDGAYNQLIGTAYDGSRPALEDTLKFIEGKLDEYGVANTTPAEDQPSVRFLSEELVGLEATARILPVVFLVVAALVLNVLTTRMVAQQRTVIGLLRAIGYGAGDIIRHYLAYGALVGIAGAVIGIAAGTWMQIAMGIMYRQFFALPKIEAHFYPGVLLTGLAVSLVFAVSGTARGAWLAVRLEPAEAMRAPAPEAGHRVLAERAGFLWRALPFRWKMITRAIFRNRFRSSVSVFSGLVSTALVFAALNNYGALGYMIDYEFERTARQDFTVSLRDAVGEGGVREVADLPGVTAVEPQLEVVSDLSNGPFTKRVAVTGMASGNRLHTPLNAAGKPIVVAEEGLVLTRKLADILSVREGARLELRPLVGRRLRVEAPVVSVVDTYLGLSAYADITYLSRLVGEEWASNEILGRSAGGSARGSFFAALKEMPKMLGVSQRSRSLKLINDTMEGSLGTFIFIMVLFSGIIAVGSMLNTALVSLSEREREVGSLRVLGYTPQQVLQLFAGEGFVLNAIGIAVGLVAGVGLAKLLSMAYYTELYRFPMVVYKWQFAVSAALMIVFFGVAQYIIYRMILALKWLDVLKSKE